MRFRIEQTRHIAAYLCGRSLYQEMLVWETAEQTMSGAAELEFARIWRAIPKVVFSRTLNAVVGNARLATDNIAAEFDRLRDQPGAGVVSIGGAGLAAAAIGEDLIDEYRQFVNPIILGGGTPYGDRARSNDRVTMPLGGRSPTQMRCGSGHPAHADLG
ncbi:dihydrofolate reductase family protein [Nocardia pseudovaccinii]|uniref:dihydrofolate reductase family protein n=1 Tax=Nocardia pseudovaccinii TaxID=189540 RepID=UPI003D93BF0D